jgi:hypothetical protein
MVIAGLSVADAISSSCAATVVADVEGRNCWTLRQTESTDSPIPLFSTSSRARRKQFVVSVDCLETFGSELPLHGQCYEEFLAHQAETDFLHGSLIGKELHLHGTSMSDTPRAAELAETRFVQQLSPSFPACVSGF